MSQCSIHPIVVYYVSDVPAHSFLCISSDDFENDVNFVYKVLHETVAYIKERKPTIA